MFFPVSKVLLQQSHVEFDVKGLLIIHYALHGSCVQEILRTVRLTVPFLRRKTILSCKNLRKAMLLVYDYVKIYDSEDLKHSKINDKNVSTS